MLGKERRPIKKCMKIAADVELKAVSVVGWSRGGTGGGRRSSLASRLTYNELVDSSNELETVHF